MRSWWAVLLPQTQPPRLAEAKNFSRYFGMLSFVLAHRTTTNTVLTKFAENFALMMVLVPVPVVGLVLLMSRSTMLPWVSQPNLFCVLVGLQAGLPVQAAFRHFAEWNFSAMYLPIENGKITFGPARTGSTPSFSCAVLFTHEPGVTTPIAFRKNARVPELVCGSCASIRAVLVPPTWFQCVAVQV